jgi:nucleoside-diphosphate-sugar epimerase
MSEKLLITGASGFIGTHLLRELAKTSADNQFIFQSITTLDINPLPDYSKIFGDKNCFLLLYFS